MRSRTLLPLALLLCLVVPAGRASADPGPGQVPPRWRIDTAHSELSFRIRHLVSRVSGTFNEWSGTLRADPADLSTGAVEVEIRTASIFTNQERRDTHLRSADFFDAEAHPRITFRSTRVESRGGALRVHGDLTIRGVTRPVVLEGRLLEVTGAPGRRRIGFEAETRINRLDYGLTWNRAAEGGGVVLGDEVTIRMAVAAAEQADG
jgi:polyisoprenoid-binding protein YceI